MKNLQLTEYHVDQVRELVKDEQAEAIAFSGAEADITEKL
jgi:hypothetical protein